jgi:hypothetical protein
MGAKGKAKNRGGKSQHHVQGIARNCKREPRGHVDVEVTAA